LAGNKVIVDIRDGLSFLEVLVHQFGVDFEPTSNLVENYLCVFLVDQIVGEFGEESLLDFGNFVIADSLCEDDQIASVLCEDIHDN
jgi:hypothetical protein